MAKVVMPPEVRVTVDPITLTFTYQGQGTVEWSSSEHTVTGPMLAIDGLTTSLPSTPWTWKLD
jgi:hypothetical protein